MTRTGIIRNLRTHLGFLRPRHNISNLIRARIRRLQRHGRAPILTLTVSVQDHIYVAQTTTYQTSSLSVKRGLRIRQCQTHTVTHETTRNTNVMTGNTHLMTSYLNLKHANRNTARLIVSINVNHCHQTGVNTSKHNIGRIYTTGTLNVSPARIPQRTLTNYLHLRYQSRHLRRRHHLTQAQGAHRHSGTATQGVSFGQLSNVSNVNHRTSVTLIRRFIIDRLQARTLKLNTRGQHSATILQLLSLICHADNSCITTTYSNGKTRLSRVVDLHRRAYVIISGGRNVTIVRRITRCTRRTISVNEVRTSQKLIRRVRRTYQSITRRTNRLRTLTLAHKRHNANTVRQGVVRARISRAADHTRGQVTSVHHRKPRLNQRKYKRPTRPLSHVAGHRNHNLDRVSATRLKLTHDLKRAHTNTIAT